MEDTYWGVRTASWNYHQAHQNAMSAFILSTIPEFQSKTVNGKEQWNIVKENTIDFWDWLQTEEGAIAGGATNSFNGDYRDPAGYGVTGYFNGLPYVSSPQHINPPSNELFIYQTISMERNAEYCYLSDDLKSCKILKKWVNWILSLSEEILLPNNDYQVPSNISFQGQPSNYSSSSQNNSKLHVSIKSYDKNIGCASLLARVLTYYAAITGDQNAKELARDLLDRMFLYSDSIGIGVNETLPPYSNFIAPIPVAPCHPPDCPKIDGVTIKPGVSFIDIRSWYKNDPLWPIIVSGSNAVFTFHRFWEQAQYAIACAEYARFFGNTTNIF